MKTTKQAEVFEKLQTLLDADDCWVEPQDGTPFELVAASSRGEVTITVGRVTIAVHVTDKRTRDFGRQQLEAAVAYATKEVRL